MLQRDAISERVVVVVKTAQYSSCDNVYYCNDDHDKYRITDCGNDDDIMTVTIFT